MRRVPLSIARRPLWLYLALAPDVLASSMQNREMKHALKHTMNISLVKCMYCVVCNREYFCHAYISRSYRRAGRAGTNTNGFA